MAESLDLIKLTKDLSALQEKANLVEQLQKENKRLKEQLHKVPVGCDQLLEDNHLKQARIDALEKQLKIAQTRIQKWRQRYVLSSSPVGSDGITSSTALGNKHTVGGTTPRCAPSIHDDAATTDIHSMTTEQRALRMAKGPLIEISGNLRNYSASRKRKAHSHADAVPLVAEDGECYKSVKHEFHGLEHTTIKTAAHRRVGDLLSEPGPSLPVLRANNTSPAKKSPLKTNHSSRPLQSIPPKENNSLPNTPKRPVSFLASKPRVSSGVEDLEPFRSRPIHQLSLAHFKLNPVSDNSLDHGFSEVVRHREQRKCLPGCTRPRCCGTMFKALASSSDLGVSDNELLRSFLGPNSEDRIRNLTTIARTNLVEEAKTKLVADIYGKHRNSHDRAQSPPGFWRTEMPETQEQLQDREQSRLQERQEVERRYREACRGDGKWIFADE